MKEQNDNLQMELQLKANQVKRLEAEVERLKQELESKSNPKEKIDFFFFCFERILTHSFICLL
jgi:hypothetical protein